jgi:hypothetical protein
MSGWARYSGANHRWTWPTGSALQFCHCQRESDVYRYQSQQFDLLLIDEATHFTEFQVRYLLTRNRATVDGLVPLMVLATNPGNVGHLWFRDQFVDLGPWGEVHEWTRPDQGPETHLFIRAKLADNVIGNERDPGYRATLEAQPEKTRRALLLGDWDVFEGQFFSEWRRDKHVIKPKEIPASWPRWRAVDWGFASPWACLWFARQPGTDYHVIYREAYGAGLTDPEQAAKIKSMTPDDEHIERTYADPSMWTKSTRDEVPISSADVYKENGVPLTRAINDRIPGWRRVRELMHVNPMSGQPNLQIFETCTNAIRTVPAQIHDDTRVEDMDTDGEDHLADCVRYGTQQRVKVRRRAPKKEAGRWAAQRRQYG